MATTAFKGTTAHTVGELPVKGSRFEFQGLLKKDLSEISSKDYAGKYKVLNIFPSIDTGVCATSVRKFNKEATSFPHAVVINVSKDLPFAIGRFCGAEGIENCEGASSFRSDFGVKAGVDLADTPLKGLHSRAVIVLSPKDEVLYTELVPDIGQEPNYEKALAALK